MAVVVEPSSSRFGSAIVSGETISLRYNWDQVLEISTQGQFTANQQSTGVWNIFKGALGATIAVNETVTLVFAHEGHVQLIRAQFTAQ